MIPDSSSPVSAAPATTQTWAAIATAVAGAIAVIAKKRFTRPRASTLNPQHSTAALQHTLETLSAKLDSNHKELVTAISTQSTAIEKRLDSLESTVARLDERTRLQKSPSVS